MYETHVTHGGQSLKWESHAHAECKREQILSFALHDNRVNDEFSCHHLSNWREATLIAKCFIEKKI